MDLQFSHDHIIELQDRKFSQNTCASSSDISPNSDDRRHDQCSGPKSLNAFSPGTPSSQTQQSPQKAFLSLSIPTLPSLQNQTHDLSINITQQSMNQISTNQAQRDMEEQTSVESTSNKGKIKNIQHQSKQLMASGLIEANIKREILARQNVDLKICANLMPGYNSHNFNITTNYKHKPQCSKNITTTTSLSTQKPTRPLPTYIQARPALYTWIRNLCRQMNMCFDVLAMTMKYLDEYHLTYGHAYDRSTFTVNAYGMIILASKLMNKQILTPKVISEKIGVSKEDLEALEIKLIQMMSFKVYFETHVKELQRKLQKWEEICQKLCLKQQLSFFGQNIFAFKRFYLLIREVERIAKVNVNFTQEMLLAAFIKSLSGQFKRDYRAEIFLAQVLTEVFDSLSGDKREKHSFERILQRIRNEMEVEDEGIWEEVKKCYDERENKEVFVNYNVFLNSILDINI